MKVLQVGMGDHAGGVEAFVMNYYRRLSNRAEFHFVSMYGNIAYRDEIEALGGRVYIVPNVKRDYKGYVSQMREILKRERYDVVHVNMLSAANILPLRLAKEAGVPKIIAHAHNASAPGIVRQLMHRYNRSKVTRYATTYCTCGKKAGEWMFPAKVHDRIYQINNAIEISKYAYQKELRDQIRKEQKIAENDIVVGHIGRFEVQKNHTGLLDHFAAYHSKEPQTVLLCVGDGVLLKEMKERARTLGILDAVRFAGHQTEIGAYLSAMDIFCLPSLFEGLPFTLVEAQANGLRCVISDTITAECILVEDAVTSVPLSGADGRWTEAFSEAAEKGRIPQETVCKGIQTRHYAIEEAADRLFAIYQE